LRGRPAPISIGDEVVEPLAGHHGPRRIPRHPPPQTVTARSPNASIQSSPIAAAGLATGCGARSLQIGVTALSGRILLRVKCRAGALNVLGVDVEDGAEAPAAVRNRLRGLEPDVGRCKLFERVG
jgi:hypothetical protein